MITRQVKKVHYKNLYQITIYQLSDNIYQDIIKFKVEKIGNEYQLIRGDTYSPQLRVYNTTTTKIKMIEYLNLIINSNNIEIIKRSSV